MARTSVCEGLTPDQELIITAIESGSYFYENIVPAGVMNGVNVTFVLPFVPNPSTSLSLSYNGARQKEGALGDFTLAGDTITLVNPPISGDILLANFRVSPV